MKGDYTNFVTKEEHDPVYRVKRVSAYLGGPGGLVREQVGGVPLTKLIDDVTPVTYVGESAVGTATASASWRVKKIDETNDPDVTIKWAGTGEFDQVWDNRASLIYS